ncbi:trifunctional dihydropteroate synthetase [Chytridiales sp. JEL 0842]|nr:trifunctional dihydropteroate synthetase [Chytridiales sp. JEL 0842]
MDKIVVRNLQVRNIIGVDSWERIKRQPLNITLTIATDVSRSGKDDLLANSVNYGTVTKVVTEFSEKTSYRSIEALALGIARVCINKFGVPKITVKVDKPRALLHAASAGVEITRTKQQIEELNELEKRLAKEPEPKLSLGDGIAGDDRIFIKELCVSTIIGVNAWERIEKQRVIVDVIIHLEFQHGLLLHDKVPKIHNYRTLTRTLTRFLEESSYKTVEALATNLAKLLVLTCHAPKVTIGVRKPSALVFADSAGLEITRDRASFDKEVKESYGETRAAPVDGLHNAILALGSNLGDRSKNINRGIDLLQISGHVKLIDTSFLYETAPMYVTDQPKFLNAACKVHTDLSPEDLLKLIKETELTLGRDFSTIRNGPRPLDIDIIFYDNLEQKTETLEIPHPRITEREFVLRPLCDIIPNFEHPSLFKTCSQLLDLLLHAEGYVKEDMYRVTPLGSTVWKWGESTRVMGILNVTPDSFSDGGQFNSVDRALEHVQAMIAANVDIIDIGGQSTRPGAEEVSEEIELERVVPVIKAIRQAGIDLPISVDTYRANVALAAVEAGANLINDVTAGLHDPKMFDTMAKTHMPVCLMHMRGTPKTMTALTQYEENDVIQGIKVELTDRIQRALAAGVRRWNIIADPGVGFAKNAEQNFGLLRRLGDLIAATSPLSGFPLLVGPSRKRFLGDATKNPDPKDRVWATAAACTAAVFGGAAILRVHDVKEMKDVIAVADILSKK